MELLNEQNEELAASGLWAHAGVLEPGARMLQPQRSHSKRHSNNTPSRRLRVAGKQAVAVAA